MRYRTPCRLLRVIIHTENLQQDCAFVMMHRLREQRVLLEKLTFTFSIRMRLDLEICILTKMAIQ